MPTPRDSALDVKWRQGIVMTMKLTAVFEKVPEGYIAYVEELPGANKQGRTLEEARSNLQEAVEMVLDASRALAEESLYGRSVIRESLGINGDHITNADADARAVRRWPLLSAA